MPGNTQCACPGDLLTYTCTVVGARTTLWGGTAFNCPSTTNEIVLRHSQFAVGGASGDCNNGAIVGQSVGVEGNRFTSQLNVTVSTSLNNKTVQCAYDSGVQMNTVDEASLNVISGIKNTIYVHRDCVKILPACCLY